MEIYDWYVDLRRYGTVPILDLASLERLTVCITGIDHIRESIPFARTLNELHHSIDVRNINILLESK